HLDAVAQLARRQKRLGDALLRNLAYLPTPPSPTACVHRLDGSRLILLRGSSPTLHCQDRALLILDEGDVLLPDTLNDLEYRAQGAVLLAGYDHASMLEATLADPVRGRQWAEFLMVRQALLLRLLAGHASESTPVPSAFTYFQPGETL